MLNENQKATSTNQKDRKMTSLKKPVRRESHRSIREAGKERPIIISIEPPGIVKLRAKGCRKSYSLPAEVCYVLAVKAHVAAEKKAKKKKRKDKK